MFSVPLGYAPFLTHGQQAGLGHRHLLFERLQLPSDWASCFLFIPSRPFLIYEQERTENMPMWLRALLGLIPQSLPSLLM